MTSENSPSAPPPLVTAASVTAVEGLVLLALAVLEIASLTGGRLTMGLTTALFFAAFGLLLMACGWLITRRAHLGRGSDPAGAADRPRAWRGTCAAARRPSWRW